MPRTSSCFWVRSLAGLFAAQGIDVPTVFARAGVNSARLECPDERFGVDEVSRLWDVAVASSGRADLGLDRVLASRYGNFDVVGFAMLSSPDLRAGLEGMSRYMAVVSDAASLDLQPGPSDACWVLLGGTGNVRPIPRQREAYGMLTVLMLCEWLTRRPMKALAIEWRFPEPPESARYRAVFDCPMRFGQPENRALLCGADMRQPLPSRNASMLALHDAMLRTQLEALGGARFSARVREEIVRRLPGGEPRCDEVAASLALADRTLQRRLHDEDTTFATLLDEARRELACRYLAEEHRPLCGVADLLGFSDPSNFYRACKRWFGEPPSQYRSGVLAKANATTDGVDA